MRRALDALSDLLVLGALGLITYGAYLIWIPLAYLVGGAFLLVVGLYLGHVASKRK